MSNNERIGKLLEKHRKPGKPKPKHRTKTKPKPKRKTRLLSIKLQRKKLKE